MALGRRGLRRSAEPGRTSGRQGEAFRLADLGHIAPGRQRQAPGRRDRRRGRRKSFETWQRERRRRDAWRVRGSPPAERRRGSRPTSVGRPDWRQWRCRRRASKWHASRSAQTSTERKPHREVWNPASAEPRRYRPGEGQSGPEGNNFRKNPLRTIPALERKVVECSL